MVSTTFNLHRAKSTIGEQRRLDSIARRKQEENERKNIIKQSLTQGGEPLAKRIRFQDPSDEDESESEHHGICVNSPQKKPEVTTPNTSEGNDDPRFRMTEHFSGNEVGKRIQNQSATANPKLQRPPPFRRYDPTNPEHTQWVRNQQPQPNEDIGDRLLSGRKADGPQTNNGEYRTEKAGPIMKHEQAKGTSESTVDPNFARELRQKLKSDVSGDQERPFSFLSMLGRAGTTQNGPKQEASTETLPEEQIGKQTAQTFVKSNSSNERISLYTMRPANGEHKPYFFTDASAEDIRSSMSSFRRHQTEEELRQSWPKQRERIVKFIKSQRKSALKHARGNQQVANGQQRKNESLEAQEEEWRLSPEKNGKEKVAENCTEVGGGVKKKGKRKRI